MSEPGEHLIASTDRHWAAAQQAMQTAEGLYIEAHRASLRRPVIYLAGPSALMACMEIIRLNQPGEFRYDWQAMYWAGRMESAMQVIREIEKRVRV